MIPRKRCGTSNRIVGVRGLVKSYAGPAGRLEVLRGLDLSIGSGEMVAVVGASGVGESSLLHVLGGLRPHVMRVGYASGDYAINQMDDEARVAFRNRHVGFVFQFHHLLPEFTALENVEMPLLIAGKSHAEAREQAAAVIARVGLSHRLAHRPGALSGGEQQRIAVARALVARPALLLADEPTGNLDESTASNLHALLRDMHKHALTSVIVTHNLRLAALCDRAVKLEGGRISPVQVGGASS